MGYEEDRRQQLTCVHCGYQGQKAPDQTGDTDVPKVNSLIRLDGEKKMYIQLAPDTMLWICQKIGVI